MNFKKLMIVVVAAVILIGGYMYFTQVDNSDPVAVAGAFTAALKDGDTAKASKYWVPSSAQAWREGLDRDIEKMKSGAKNRYFDSVPADPAFTTSGDAASGKLNVVSEDKTFTVEMTQIDGQWYVSKISI